MVSLISLTACLCADGLRIFFRFYIEDGSHCMFIAVQIASQFEEADESGTVPLRSLPRKSV